MEVLERRRELFVVLVLFAVTVSVTLAVVRAVTLAVSSTVVVRR